MSNWTRRLLPLRPPSESTVKWAELAKTLAEIAAILVAGWWAYTRFLAGEAPSLEERGSTESTLEWVEGDQRCTAFFGVAVKNIGKRAFDIDQTTVRVWLVTPPEPTAGITQFDPSEIMKTPSSFSRTLPAGTFTTHYAPDTGWHDDLAFSIPRDPDAHRRIALFAFEPHALASDGRPLKTALYEYRWSANCDVSVSQQAKP